MINMTDDKENASIAASRSQDDVSMNIPTDPDAHLTTAEKADVVSAALSAPPWSMAVVLEMLTSPGVLGPSSPVEARQEAYAMGKAAAARHMRALSTAVLTSYPSSASCTC